MRHLLSHLNDLPGLRKNALVADLFDAGVDAHAVHAQIRTIVTDALDAVVAQHASTRKSVHGTRWRAIVERCDLGGEAHDVVARDLGLEERQFYRERRAAREALADAIGSRVRALRGGNGPIPGDTELLIEFAAGLSGLGRLNDAAAILEDIVSRAEQAPLRLAAITELIDAYATIGKGTEFPRLLDAARKVCYGSPTLDPVLEVELHMSEALIARYEGAASQCMSAFQRVISRLSLSRVSSHARTFDLAMRAALELAHVHLSVGNASQAEQLLSVARNFTARSNAHGHRVRLLGVKGELHLLRGELSKAAVATNEGFVLARSQRSVEEMMRASQLLSVIHVYREDWEPAEKHARNSLALAESLGLGRDRIGSLITLAQIEIDRGNAEHALVHCRRAAAHLAHGEGEVDINKLVTAEAMLHTGRVKEALALANSATARLGELGYHRFFGYGERVRAQIFHRLHRRKDAVESINRALTLLERYGTQYSLKRAYAASSAITGNRVHHARSREIASQFREPLS